MSHLQIPDHHDHPVRGNHKHRHGAVDPSIFATERGIRAVLWSSLAMLITALLQSVVVGLSGSVALLADTIHNFSDAATAIPLLIAFRLGSRKATKRFTYGYGRVEDIAGVVVILFILSTACVAAFESIRRFSHPQSVERLFIVMVAAVIGFLGNEFAARFRIHVGQEIGSAALMADGHHARVDGLTSLSVLFGALGVKLGYPVADPVVGLVITAIILRVLWKSIISVFSRLLDGVDPEVVDEIREAAKKIREVQEVTDVRVRWVGHRMHAEVNVAVDSELSVNHAHEIAKEIEHQLMHDLTYLSNATIHMDPSNASGEKHHRITSHEHGDFPSHSH